MYLRSIDLTERIGKRTDTLGTVGHLAVFLWLLGMVVLAPGTRVIPTTVLCLGVGFAVYPESIRRTLKLRWLCLMLLLAVPSLFFLGEPDSIFWGLHYSSEGLQAGLQIASRFVVVLVAVQGFTSAVEITALAGLLERFGMQGLGFTIGVALNLLPYMQQSCVHAWQSLRMRGGLRRRWWHSLRLLVTTIVVNAMGRAEEVALAAEARAFNPDRARPIPIHKGSLDWLFMAAGVVSLIAIVLL